MKESTRAYIYRILVVAVPILGFYGIAQEGEAQLWLAGAATVLGLAGNGLATLNTSTDSNNP